MPDLGEFGALVKKSVLQEKQKSGLPKAFRPRAKA
jgi:hypothetical protein